MGEMNRDKRYVVFAGAGASCAVDNKSYPTTVEFFNRLPRDVSDDALVARTLEFVRGQLPAGTQIDVELLLWHLEVIREFCRRVQAQDDPIGFFLQHDRLAQSVGKRHANVGHLMELAGTAHSHVDRLVDKIYRLVYDFYSREPSAEELNRTWMPLLKPLAETGAMIDLVTTNYDLVLESCIDLLESHGLSTIERGWLGRTTRSLNVELWTQPSEKLQKRGLLTKLHGSVNWTRGADRIYIGDPTFKGTHKNHSIIYPGFKGRPAETAFLTLHDYFATRLRLADGIVFIGFAFRDEYINDICVRSIGRDVPVVILNPNTPKLPSEQWDARFVMQGLDGESAKFALQFLFT